MLPKPGGAMSINLHPTPTSAALTSASLTALFIAQLPIPLLKGLAHAAASLIDRYHPGLGERLAEAEGSRFHFQLVDCPFDGSICVENGRLQIDVLSKEAQASADVVVKGRLEALLDLMQGRYDGDALFFTREIETRGDTGALLSLRNALENEEIDLVLLASRASGPFAPLVRALVSHLSRRATQTVAQLEGIFSARLQPFMLAQRALDRRLSDIEQRLGPIERAARKGRNHEAA